MNIIGMLTELREEADRVDEAIVAIEHLVQASGKRRGRPPKWLSNAERVKPDQGALLHPSSN